MIKSIQVVRIVTRMNIGGPSLHVALLSNHLDPVKFSTSLIVGQGDPSEGSRLRWVEQGPARLHRVGSLRRPLNLWRDCRAFGSLLHLIWKERPRVIHTHMAKAGALGRLAGMAYNRWGPGRQAGNRVILIHTFHGHVLEGYFPRWVAGLFTGLERWLAKRTDCLVAVSEGIRDSLLALGIGKPGQWRVIRLGVDCSELNELPLPDNGSVLRCGLVGRLVPIKNPQLFLRAMTSISRESGEFPVRGRIIGDGPLRPELEEAVRQMGLQGIISFPGWQEDAKDTYAGLDVVCITSRNEGTPLSLIEAMAAGRAVVSTAVGGVPDLLGFPRDREIPSGGFEVAARGLLIQEGDELGFAAALTALAKDPVLRRKLAQAGRHHVREEYSHTRLLREIEELYQHLAGGSG